MTIINIILKHLMIDLIVSMHDEKWEIKIIISSINERHGAASSNTDNNVQRNESKEMIIQCCRQMLISQYFGCCQSVDRYLGIMSNDGHLNDVDWDLE